MSNAIDAEKVRSYVANTLGSYGAQNLEELHESILIRGGLFCGRKYQCDGYQGIWFIEEDQIKFFAPCGNILLSDSLSACIFRTEQGNQQSTETRRAA